MENRADKSETCPELWTQQQSELLRRTQDSYRDLVENSSELICSHDLDGLILSANRAASRILGYDPENYCGKKNLREILAPEVRDQFDDYLAKIRADGEASGVMRIETSTGERRIWEYHNTLRTEAVSGPIVLGIARDITERQRAERALRESEERFRSYFELGLIGAAITSLAKVWIEVNDKLCEILGYERSELLKMTWEELTHPDDLAADVANFDMVLAGECEGYAMDKRYIHKDGQIVHASISVKCLRRADGSVNCFVVLVQDITKRKRAEERLREAEQKYRDIFENAGEGIFQSSPEGRYIIANPALAHIYGFDSPEELIRSRDDISQQIYVEPERREDFKRLLEEQGAVRGFENEAFRKDGTRIWVSVNARGVRNEHGAIVYYEGTVQDISERKRAENRVVCFTVLARRLSGVTNPLDAAQIIVDTAADLFGWDSCTFDLYDAGRDVVHPVLNVDTIAQKRVDVTPLWPGKPPTPSQRRVIDSGAELIIRAEPCEFAEDSLPFGDISRPSASIMRVPIKHFLKTIAIFSIQSYQPHAYDSLALKDLQGLADLCGEALNRIRAERSLSESEERFRQFADNIDDVIWMVDTEMKSLLYVNPAYERIWGRSTTDLYQNMLSFLVAVHPDDLEKVNRTIRRQREACTEVEYRIIRPDGEIRWIHDCSFPITDTQGKVYRVAGISEDITDRKKNEDDLIEQKEILERIFDNIPVMINLTDKNGRIKLVNREWQRTLGWSLQEIESEHIDVFAECYPDPEARQKVTDFIAASNGAWQDFKTRIRDNSVIDTSWLRIPLSDGTTVGIGQDITDRKQAENRLRKAEHKYRELFENSREAIYVHDLNGIYTSVNRAAEKLSGYSWEEILGQHFRGFVAPEYETVVRQQLCRKLEATGETSYEIEMIRKEGRRVPVEVSSRLIYENGVPVGVQGTARDITERKRAEEARARLAAIVESSDDAIFSVGLDKTILSWNRGAERIYGYAAEEVTGCPITIVVPPERHDEVRLLQERLRTGESTVHFETVRVRKDGSTIDVSLTVSPIRDGTGKIVAASTIVRDITEQKQAREQLRDFSRRLIKAQEAERKNIARELHDEIGQVLTGVRINLQSLQCLPKGVVSRKRIEESIVVVDEALGLVRELSFELRPSLLDDLGLPAALRWYVKRYAERTGITADVFGNWESDDRLPRELETACFRITQEALTNVARHAQATGVSVHLKRSGEKLRLLIRDNGLGFEVDNLLAHASSVSVLGLRGMAERAHAVEGRIDIDSGPGRGTEVCATFPLTK